MCQHTWQKMGVMLQKNGKKLLKNGKNNKPKQILDEVFAFADQHPQDPMALSASLLVVAKTIYLDILGPEQTSEMFYAFAQDLEHHDYKKVTIH
jgi:hypothetical protein